MMMENAEPTTKMCSFSVYFVCTVLHFQFIFIVFPNISSTSSAQMNLLQLFFLYRYADILTFSNCPWNCQLLYCWINACCYW